MLNTWLQKLKNKCTINSKGCWLWQGSKTSGGYAQITANGKAGRGHRLVFHFCVRPLVFGEHVLHSCDEPACINPEHLFTGSHQDNMDDRSRKGRNTGKLKPEDVIIIANSCLSLEAISDQFGIGVGAVSRIHTGKNFRILLNDSSTPLQHNEHVKRYARFLRMREVKAGKPRSSWGRNK